MDSARPIVASTGFERLDTGMAVFTTGNRAEKPVTGRGKWVSFGCFGDATSRLRPRYRDGHRHSADGDGYHD